MAFSSVWKYCSVFFTLLLLLCFLHTGKSSDQILFCHFNPTGYACTKLPHCLFTCVHVSSPFISGSCVFPSSFFFLHCAYVLVSQQCACVNQLALRFFLGFLTTFISYTGHFLEVSLKTPSMPY